MNELLQQSVYFGVALSIFAYWIGVKLKQKWNYPLLNPLLIAMILIIAFLMAFRIDYETFDYGAKYLTYFLTPATVCLAVPLYKQLEALKENKAAVLVSILSGCIAHVMILAGLAAVLHLDKGILLSMLPKSVTTPIALGISAEIGGISPITVIGVCIAGILGAVLGPAILKWCRVTEPVAQGLGMGTASHAIGTSKAIELGEVQAAMSSLAIVVTGILTVIIVPIVIEFL